jgi:hypothetical protein
MGAEKTAERSGGGDANAKYAKHGGSMSETKHAFERSASPASFTPGPWKACNEGKCSCLRVWSTVADHPVCKVESGEWGDDYPSLRFTKETGAGSIGATVEPYMEFIPYGSIDQIVAEANAHLIAAAPDLLEALKAVVGEMRREHDAGDGHFSTSQVVAAEAAIAKATGGQL